jgi:hypothetical protein
MWQQRVSYLRECTIVPEVPLVREAVADETELALLDILLDGVEEFLLGDLDADAVLAVVVGIRMVPTYLHLAIGPSWDLNDHVQDGLLLIGVQGDIVERRDGYAILLDVDAVLQSIRSSDLSDFELAGHVRRW